MKAILAHKDTLSAEALMRLGISRAQLEEVRVEQLREGRRAFVTVRYPTGEESVLSLINYVIIDRDASVVTIEFQITADVRCELELPLGEELLVIRRH